MKQLKKSKNRIRLQYHEYLEGILDLSVYVKVKYPHQFNYDNIDLISFLKKNGMDVIKQLSTNKYFLNSIKIMECNIVQLVTPKQKF